MTETRLEQVAEELSYLYRRQTTAERADPEGRVANRAVWRDAISERAERIRQLERERDRLVADEEATAELGEAYRDEAAA